jgi:hypothetical protein
MIDTARHFMPVEFLQHIIDGMAANRLNILHCALVVQIIPHAWPPPARCAPEELR